MINRARDRAPGGIQAAKVTKVVILALLLELVIKVTIRLLFGDSGDLLGDSSGFRAAFTHLFWNILLVRPSLAGLNLHFRHFC